MALLQHWLRDGDPFFDDHDVEQGRKERFAQADLALAHPYLLHTILAIAALDKFKEDTSDSRWFKLATSHHVTAVKHARPNLSNESEQQAAAMYHFSAFNSLLAFAEPPLRLETNMRATVDPVRDMLTAFRLARGITSIQTARKSELDRQGLPNKSIWRDERSAVREDVQLASLTGLVQSSLSDQKDINALTEAIRELFTTLALLQRMSAKDSSAHLIMVWAIKIDESFLKLCDADEPVALVVLAHYAVMLHLRRNLWFFERWPPMLLLDIERKLPTEWSAQLAWPKRAILENDLSEIGILRKDHTSSSMTVGGD